MTLVTFLLTVSGDSLEASEPVTQVLGIADLFGFENSNVSMRSL